jgi:YidC/Oxa1 family membrane protein insertase
MERRVLIAILLSVVVLYAYQAFFVPTPPPGAKTPAASAAAPASNAAPPPPTEVSQPANAVVPTPATVVGEEMEHEIVLDSSTVRAVLTNRGARIAHWYLKSYKDDAGREVDLVPQNVPGQPLPFSLRLDDPGQSARVNSAMFRATAPDPAHPLNRAFDYQDASGLRVHKEFTLEPMGFVVKFSVTVAQNGAEQVPFIEWGPGLGDQTPSSGGGGFFSGGSASQPPEAIFHNAQSVERVAARSVNEKPAYDAPFRFVGVDDHYFIAAAVDTGQARVEYRSLTVPVPGNEKSQRQFVLHTLRVLQPQRGIRYYIGPKSFDELKAVDGEFVRAINYGIWSFLSVPFLSALKWIDGYTGNYGWAIIVLTILMNVVIFPLRHKSFVSMKKMQQIQPQLKAIQDRYKDLKVTDPARQKMNTEVMNLYREKGVNPASGCIPMLLTFPVLFAFYSLLSQSIELRGAPFGFWIRDLSVMDPYYVTPLLMGATMFWQQKMAPPSADPQQQRMMMIMPVVFIAMFLRLPSGLAIYYFVNNLWGIAQQYFTNKLIGAPVVSAPRPAAERRLKPVGSGRTERAERKS